MTTTTTLTTRESMIQVASDTYKDAHGIRPRWVNFSAMSDAEIQAFTDRQQAEVEEQLAEDDMGEDAYALSLQPEAPRSTYSDTLTDEDKGRLDAYFAGLEWPS